jgi:hypothetical protein
MLASGARRADQQPQLEHCTAAEQRAGQGGSGHRCSTGAAVSQGRLAPAGAGVPHAQVRGGCSFESSAHVLQARLCCWRGCAGRPISLLFAACRCCVLSGWGWLQLVTGGLMAALFALHLRRVDEQALRLLLALQQALLLVHSIYYMQAVPALARVFASTKQASSQHLRCCLPFAAGVVAGGCSSCHAGRLSMPPPQHLGRFHPNTLAAACRWRWPCGGTCYCC